MNGLIEKLEGYLNNSRTDEMIGVQLDFAELSFIISLAYGEEAYSNKMEELMFKSFDRNIK